MKKFIFLFLALLILSHVANAQYKINNTMYDYRNYTYQEGDRYKPGNAGIISFFLYPGLGHMYAGEKGRGWAFFGANIGCIMLMVYPVFIFRFR